VVRDSSGQILAQAGYSVTVFDNFSVGFRENLRGIAVELIEDDILDQAAVSRVVEGQDGIVHLAAQTGVPASLADPRKIAK
jgi:UDP-glucose 4-epimerase